MTVWQIQWHESTLTNIAELLGKQITFLLAKEERADNWSDEQWDDIIIVLDSAGYF